MDILAVLQSEMDHLSQSEQRIAKLLFDDAEFATNASIIELATRAEVSPPTVTRFCRRLGCQGYSEFKVRLAQTTFVGARYLKPDIQAASAAQLAQDIVNSAQTALYAAHSGLDFTQLDVVASRIASAPMIYAFGSGGNSSMFASEMQNRLFRLGLRVTSSDDHAMQLMLAAAAKKDDIIIASSVSGQNTELAKALSAANDYKVFSVALTRPNTPVSIAAGMTVPIDILERQHILQPTAARYAFLAVIDILATLVATRVGAGATETLRRIKHQVVTYRDKTDKEPLGD